MLHVIQDPTKTKIGALCECDGCGRTGVPIFSKPTTGTWPPVVSAPIEWDERTGGAGSVVICPLCTAKGVVPKM